MTETNTTNNIEASIPDNPFPGLRPFRTDEAHLFFGRRKQSDEVLDKLLSHRFCAVTGASGSGKSSLIYCGVITALQKKQNNHTEKWNTIISRPGNSPMMNLLQKISKLKEIVIEDEIEKPEDFSVLLRKLFPDGKEQILIIIDQFEELFRYSEKENIKKTNSPHFFTRLLTELVKQNTIPVYLIVTMRSDYIGECSQFPDFTALINSSNYLVPRMKRENFREVVEGPINTVGAKISSNLVEKILEELGDNPDQLPVLQHALMRTWSYWNLHNDINRPLSLADYDAVGRLEKALSEHANEAFNELNEEEKELCEKIFRTITEKGSDNKGVRKPVRLDKLIEITMAGRNEVIKVLDIFRTTGRSFISPSIENNLTNETIVDISHESFMRIWDRLRAWVDEEASSVQMYKRLAESAFQYQTGRSGLWRPPDLQLAINWYKKNKPTLAWAERHNPAFERTMVFLDTSEQVFIREEKNKLRLQKRQLRRTRLFALVLGVAAIIALGLFIWTRELQIKSEKEFQRAETQRQLAELKTLEAQQQSELAEKAAKEAGEQRSLAENQSKIAEEQRLEAERMAKESRRQAVIATENLHEATKQRGFAIASEKEAQGQRVQAEKAREEAFQRRMLTIAKSMAVKSQQVTTDPDLRALLALQAYSFNERFKGTPNDVDIYTGLYQALKFSLGTSYNVYEGHNEAVRSVQFIPGAYSFISASSEGRILKWDVNDPVKKYSVISEGRNLIETIKITPDAKWLVCAENKEGIFLYELEGKSNITRVLKGIDNYIRAIAIAPDSKTLYSTGLGNIIEYWDISTGQSRRFSEPGTRVNSLALSPDGVLLAGGTREGKLIIWQTKGETVSAEVYSDSANAIQSVVFAPDYKYLATGNIKGEIHILRADNFELVRILSGHKARITDLSFSPDGKILASSSYDGSILFYNTDDLTSPPILMNDHSGFAFTVAFSSNSKYMVSGSAEGDRLIARPAYSNLLAEQICKLVSRNLTPEEWRIYVGPDIKYEETCRTARSFSIDVRQ